MEPKPEPAICFTASRIDCPACARATSVLITSPTFITRPRVAGQARYQPSFVLHLAGACNHVFTWLRGGPCIQFLSDEAQMLGGVHQPAHPALCTQSEAGATRLQPGLVCKA